MRSYLDAGLQARQSHDMGLLEELAQSAENIPHMADERVVSQNGVAALHPVEQKDAQCEQHAAEKREHKQRRQEIERFITEDAISVMG